MVYFFRPKIKGVSEAATERLIKLVPELCIMTGLTDAMRADFRIMKEVGGFTRQSPAQRQVNPDQKSKNIIR